MNVQPVTISKRIAFLGDSRCKIFDGRVLRCDDDIVLAQARWVPYIRAGEFFHDGRIHPYLARSLWDLRFLRGEEDATGDPAFGSYGYHGYDDEPRELHFAAQAQGDAIVVSCGIVDAIELEHRLTGTYWFELDPPLDYPVDGVPAYRAPTQLGYHVVFERVRRTLEPAAQTLRLLAAAGIGRIYLMGLAPPPLVRLNDEHTPELRLRVFELFNRVMRATCETLGVRYLDAWELTCTNGVRDERFFRDFGHPSDAFVPCVVERVLAP